MKFWFKIVLILVLVVAAALSVKYYPGVVAIGYGHTEIKIALSLAILAILLFYYLLSRSLALLSSLWTLSERMQQWNKQRRQTQASAAYESAMLAIAEGRYDYAERELAKHAPHTTTPLLFYLAAARAAQAAERIEARDKYLALAHNMADGNALPIELTKAELHLMHAQSNQALEILVQLRSTAPKNDQVVKLLMRVCLELKEWDQLQQLLPEIKKRQILTDEEYAPLERKVFIHLLKRRVESKDLNEIKALWKGLPRHLKETPSLLGMYTRALIRHDNSNDAESLLRSYLKRHWDDGIIAIYSRLDTAQNGKQLAELESLAEKHTNNPVLLLTLARVCQKNRLWGKARTYYESSIGAGAGIAAYKEFGGLLEHMGDQNLAIDYYRKAVQIALKKTA